LSAGKGTDSAQASGNSRQPALKQVQVAEEITARQQAAEQQTGADNRIGTENLNDIMPDGFWYAPEIEQTSARSQFSTTMVGGTIHIHNLFIIGQRIVEMIEQFLQGIRRAYFTKF